MGCIFYFECFNGKGYKFTRHPAWRRLCMWESKNLFSIRMTRKMLVKMWWRIKCCGKEKCNWSVILGGKKKVSAINPLNAELNPIRHLLALVGARHIVHVSRIRVNWTHIGCILVTVFIIRFVKLLSKEMCIITLDVEEKVTFA